MRAMRSLCLIVLISACSADSAGPDVTSEVRAEVTAEVTAETLEADADIDIAPPGPVEFVVDLIESRNVDGASPYGFAIAGRRFEESTANGTTIGDCTFYPAAMPPFCDPQCAIGTICVADGECGAPLTPLSAGDITVTGLTAGLSLHPATQYSYYAPTFTPAEPADGDLFHADAHIVATATGGNVPPFEIAVHGVEDLSTSLVCPPPLQRGAALEVRWTAGSAHAVHLDLESGNHGGQFARIACDTADDGALDVDAALIDAYLDSPRPVDLWRLVRHNATTSGTVRLTAASQVSCRW